ncbi:hypothetical protein DL98DRAFT_541741 [Cadophora sp. DSE1049]|nr:hypothetical protein DL98DRAFT_541741 [Cadophora sp. DSE1049]
MTFIDDFQSNLRRHFRLCLKAPRRPEYGIGSPRVLCIARDPNQQKNSVVGATAATFRSNFSEKVKSALNTHAVTRSKHFHEVPRVEWGVREIETQQAVLGQKWDDPFVYERCAAKDPPAYKKAINCHHKNEIYPLKIYDRCDACAEVYGHRLRKASPLTLLVDWDSGCA